MEEVHARDYQLELYKSCLDGNVIIYLPTGSGKTFIVSMVLKHYLSKWRSEELIGGVGKRQCAFFLTTTVELAAQQSNFISSTIHENVGLYYGALGVDYWDRAKWLSELEKYTVFTMTAQVFLDLVRHGYLEKETVGMIIFDECHHTKKQSSYQRIMQEIYFSCERRPKILGLTASPINVSPKRSKIITAAWVEMEMLEMEKRLDAVIKTPAPKHLCTVNSVSQKPQEYVISFSADSFSLESTALHGYIEQIVGQDENYKPIFKVQQYMNQFLTLSPEKYHEEFFSFSFKEIELFKSIPLIISSLGLDALSLLISLIDELTATDHCSSRSYNLSAISVVLKSFLDRLGSKKTGYSDQVMTLIEHLRLLFDCKDNRFHGIIFVSRRLTAYLLSKIIDNHFPGKACSFVGHNIFSTPLDDFYKSQNKVALKGFRDGSKSILVATNVAEEGIDIQACNYVIRYDSHFPFISYVQSRGRARHSDSKYIVMAEKQSVSEIEAMLMAYRQTEDIMSEVSKKYYIKTCVTEDPADKDVDDAENLETSKDICYTVDATGAFVNMTSSVSLVYRFVSSLPSDEFFRMKPQFLLHDNLDELMDGDHPDDSSMFRYSLILPNNCPVKRVEGSWCSSKRNAKMDVCFKACILLHKEKALSDYLLPDKEEEIFKNKQKVKELRRKRAEIMGLSTEENKDDENCSPYIDEEEKLLAYDRSMDKSQLQLQVPCVPRPFSVLSNFKQSAQIPYHVYELKISGQLSDAGESFENVLFLLEDRLELKDDWHLDTIGLNFIEISIVDHGPLNMTKDERQVALKFTHMMISSMECSWRLRDVLTNQDFLLHDLRYLILPGTDGGHIDWMKIDSSLHFPKQSAWHSVKEKPIVEAEKILESSVLFEVNDHHFLKQKYFVFDGFSPDKMGDEMPVDFQEWTWRITFRDFYRYALPGAKSIVFDGSQPLMKVKLGPKALTPSLISSLNSRTDKPKGTTLKVSKRRHYTDDRWNRVKCSNFLLEKKFLEWYHIHPLSLSYFNTMSVVCRYLEYLEDCLVTQQFQKKYEIPNSVPLSLLMQALTSPVHDPVWNYQKLETLGDVVVKWAVAEYLFLEYPKKDEGFLTLIKSRWVSNDYLTRLSLEAKLHEYVLMENHGRGWTFKAPTGAGEMPVKTMSLKLLADLVESVSGAIYSSNWEMEPCFKFLSKFVKLIPTIPKKERYAEIYEHPEFHNASFVNDNLVAINHLEKQFYENDYKIKNKLVFLEALTHVSDPNGVFPCYQRLEFIGDALIDLFVTRHIFEKYSRYHTPGTFTFLRASLVNSTIIGRLAFIKGLHKILFFLSENMLFSISGIGRELREKFTDSILFFKDKCDRESVERSWFSMLCAEQPPKVLCDVVESLTAAYYIDNKMNLDVCREFILRILDDILAYYGNPNIYTCRQPRTILLETFQGNHCEGYCVLFLDGVRKRVPFTWKGRLDALIASDNKYVENLSSDLHEMVETYLETNDIRIPNSVLTIGLCMWHGKCLSVGHGFGKCDCRKQTERLLVRQLIQSRDEAQLSDIDQLFDFETVCTCEKETQKNECHNDDEEIEKEKDETFHYE